MKRQSHTFAALLLALLGFATILALTAAIAFGTLFLSGFGGLGADPCLNCGSLSPVQEQALAVCGVGLVIASIGFWGIFRVMRPQSIATAPRKSK